ncbi:hypothetical protein BDF14DRAFT_1758602 [Spinellus fusiger]|nr:hypothetical protein BDF14DRAFT_1758602 [Spinellus fusiger]
MASARSRSNSAHMSGSGLQQREWIADVFQPYSFPSPWDQETMDAHGLVHSVQSRFLGISSLQSSTQYGAHVAFYQVIQTETSLLDMRTKIIHESPHESTARDSGHGTTDPTDPSTMHSGGHDGSTDSADTLLALSETCVLMEASSDTGGGAERALAVLPPKKRKRHRVVRFDIVLCLCQDSPDSAAWATLSPHHTYYIFPRDAVLETRQTSPPFEVFFSFYLPTSVDSSSMLHALCSCHGHAGSYQVSYKTKLEEFAAVCSNSCRLTAAAAAAATATAAAAATTTPTSTPTAATTTPTTPTATTAAASGTSTSSMRHESPQQRRMTDPGAKASQTNHVLNMRISDVSHDLYIALKQTVAGYEAAYEKMTHLMKLHAQLVANYTADPHRRSEPRKMKGEERSSGMTYISGAYGGKSGSSEFTMPMEDEGYLQRTSLMDAWSSSDDNSWEKDTVLSPKPVPGTSFGSPQSITASVSSSSTKRGGGSSSSNGGGGGVNGSIKKCLYCGSKSTPMWRRGPQGAGTLCNACGVKWKHGKILCGNDAASTLAGVTKDNYALPKSEKKRKKTGSGAKKDKRAKVKDIKKTLHTSDEELDCGNAYTEDDDMESNIDAARNLSICEEEEITKSHGISRASMAVFAMGEQEDGSERRSRYEANSWSSSISDSYSPPLASYTSSSLPMPRQRRHTTDLSIVERMGLSSSPFTLSAGVDAVEAAAVLTLLKRS